jgi:hypothetical protein
VHARARTQKEWTFSQVRAGTLKIKGEPRACPATSAQDHSVQTCVNKKFRPVLCGQRTGLFSQLRRVELRGLEPLTPTLPVWCADVMLVGEGYSYRGYLTVRP